MNLIRYAYHLKRVARKSTGNKDVCLVFSNLDIYIFAIIGSRGQNGLQVAQGGAEPLKYKASGEK